MLAAPSGAILMSSSFCFRSTPDFNSFLLSKNIQDNSLKAGGEDLVEARHAYETHEHLGHLADFAAHNSLPPMANLEVKRKLPRRAINRCISRAVSRRIMLPTSGSKRLAFCATPAFKELSGPLPP